ncbi:hypothetical protein BFP70_04275 [Thioclava sp. SK-1]|uniref:PhzF family phenazine biosynthesis protein n=1 Tax=Thioclava sp. SK-1 TaxID=1889770 RepID=UPI00082611A1|nr:PhzF family phenazine biosynthesis protein [Thioclava sp. SK-1]OCX66456.1 hypothetical protein BFP70_04275 [Thioclava sp. SK-1]
MTGVSVFGRHDDGDAKIEVRSFAPSSGATEDPVCGSGNGAIAVYRLLRDQIAEGATYTAAQGQCVGRSGQIFVKIDAARVYIGGQAVTTVHGHIQAG